MNQIKIGAYIAVKRKEHGLTQAQLAEQLGISDKSVSKWERGVCLPDVSHFQDICDILEISINEFFAGEDIAQEALEEQSEKNIIAIMKDSIQRSGKLRKTIKTLVILVVLLLVSCGVIVAKSLHDNGYFDKNYVRMATKNEEVMSKMFGSVDRNYGIFEYSNDFGAKEVTIVANEYLNGELISSEDCFTMPIEKRKGMIGVTMDAVKGEYMVSVGDDGGVGSMEASIENEVVANEDKMTSTEFLQGTESMENGPVPLLTYLAEANGDSLSGRSAENIIATNGRCLKEAGVDYCLIVTCEFK